MKDKKSGFTLVEIIVSMAAVSILMLASGNMLVSGNRTYSHFALSVKAGETGDSIAELMKTRLQYGYDLVIAEEDEADLADLSQVGFTNDGRFCLNGKAVYGDPSESGLLAGCRITGVSDDPHVIHLEVYLTDCSGNRLYQSRETIKFFNMELSGETMDCRIEEDDGVIDSADQDVMFYYLENGRRYGWDE